MSRANAALSLPPADRDELPSQEPDRVGGRAGEAPGGGGTGTPPGAELMIEAIDLAMARSAAAFDELKAKTTVAHTDGDLAALERLALRQVALSRNLAASFAAARRAHPRES